MMFFQTLLVREGSSLLDEKRIAAVKRTRSTARDFLHPFME
jgi:hypothetical protein